MQPFQQPVFRRAKLFAKEGEQKVFAKLETRTTHPKPCNFNSSVFPSVSFQAAFPLALRGAIFESSKPKSETDMKKFSSLPQFL